MTIVYFVQHGIAESKEIDPARPLSKSGEEITARLAALLNRKDVQITKVCHSSKLRAEQTASIFARFRGFFRSPRQSPCLPAVSP